MVKICNQTNCELVCYHKDKHTEVGKACEGGCLYHPEVKCVEVKHG